MRYAACVCCRPLHDRSPSTLTCEAYTRARAAVLRAHEAALQLAMGRRAARGGTGEGAAPATAAAHPDCRVTVGNTIQNPIEIIRNECYKYMTCTAMF